MALDYYAIPVTGWGGVQTLSSTKALKLHFFFSNPLTTYKNYV